MPSSSRSDTAVSATAVASSAADPHSSARPEAVVIRHISLDLTIDFTARQLHGTATLTLDWNHVDSLLQLDATLLAVTRVEAAATHGDSWHALTFAVDAGAATHAGCLVIDAPAQPRFVRIHYATAAAATGLQWLAPAQTADHRAPFLFSQSESVYARSWVPLQDTPAVRFTWDAVIHAPRGIRVVMSAPNDAHHPLDGCFSFRQEHPVPSYLLALAAGHLEVRETGPRSAVYAEPSMLAAAAREFEDTETMIAATEALYGPYPWGRYDLLVLPPSFPYGGMENPNMTFATPTVVVGDKSLVSLVAHELAHSWSGNLVTAASWRDIWLNEGITTYVQGRITEALYGQRQADEETRLSILKLHKALHTMAPDAQRLAPPTPREDPDDTLSEVAYDKGAWFMRTLEQCFGRTRFDAWLNAYFAHFAWQSITTEQMFQFLNAHLLDGEPERMPREVARDWVYGVGIPADAATPACAPFDAIDTQRNAFLAGALPAPALDARDWNTQEWMYFLDGLPEAPPLDKLKDLDLAWRLTGTANAEIGMRWYAHAIRAGHRDVWPAAAEHVTRIGRLYLCKPVYQALVEVTGGHAFAEHVYAAARPGYHPLTQAAVERILASRHTASPVTSPLD